MSSSTGACMWRFGLEMTKDMGAWRQGKRGTLRLGGRTWLRLPDRLWGLAAMYLMYMLSSGDLVSAVPTDACRLCDWISSSKK